MFACLLQVQDAPSSHGDLSSEPPSQSHQNRASATKSDELTDTSPGVIPGLLVHKVDPKYPSKAQDRGIAGIVVLTALVAKDGKVRDVQVISGDPMLAAAAVSAVRHWRYTPYLFEGKAAEVRAQISLTFALRRLEHNCQEDARPADASNPENAAKDSVSGATAKADVPQEVYKVGGDVKPPRVISSRDPDYPEKARNAKEQGTVVLMATITPEGKVGTVRVVRSIGRGLDEKAMEAVCQWKFQPATRDGKPVATQVNVEVEFRLY
jgi:TonB family protein